MRTVNTFLPSAKKPTLITKAGVTLLLAAFGSCAIAQHISDDTQPFSTPIYGGHFHKSIIENPIDNSTVTGNATFANTSVFSTNEQVQANNHTLTIKGSDDVPLYGGSSIFRVLSGKATAGDATLASSQSYNHAYANAQVNVTNAEIHANGNTVTLSENASAKNHVHGGNTVLDVQSAYATAGNAMSPEGDTNANAHAYSYVSITGSSVQSHSNTVTATNNASIIGDVYGGKAEIYAQSSDAIAGNTIGSTASSFAHAHVVTTSSSTNANNNTVILESNASVSGNIYGGHSAIRLQSANAQAGNAIATENSASATTNIHVNAKNSAIHANNNAVEIKHNAKAAGHIYGGYSELIAAPGTAVSGTINGAPDAAYAFINASGTQLLANDNQITLNSTLQNGTIYGGYTRFDMTPGSAYRADGKIGDTHINIADSQARAVNNTVTIGDYGRISSSDTSIYGGYLEATSVMPASYDTFSGNTLNFSATPVVVDTVANFEHYNFTLQPTLANSTTALITAQDIVLGTNASNSNGADNTSKVQVVGIHSGPVLNTGDTFYLMRAENSMSGHGGSGLVTQAQQGISLLYSVQTDVDQADKVVTATILDGNTSPPGGNGGNSSSGGAENNTGSGSSSGSAAKVNPQLKALTSGQLSGISLINRGADMMTDDVFNTISEQNRYNGFNLFAHTTGYHIRYNYGSGIKANSALITGGLSYQQDNLKGGIFVEGGFGDYSSHNHFYQATHVHGDGKNRYYGVGVLGRYEFPTGIYADASVRIGKSSNTFSSRDIRNLTTGQYADYSLKSSYVSTHTGLGYQFALDDANRLDLSAKYLWTRLAGKNVMVAGDPIRFNHMDSHRVRLNADLTHQYSDTLTLKAGAGYEHEFDAKAKATTYGSFHIDAPNAKGGTGILSVGATFKPAFNPNIHFDVKARGYLGKREGGSIGATINYTF